MLELENIKACDELYNEMGIEEEQIKAAHVEHELKDDPTLKGNLTKMQAEFNKKIQE